MKNRIQKKINKRIDKLCKKYKDVITTPGIQYHQMSSKFHTMDFQFADELGSLVAGAFFTWTNRISFLFTHPNWKVKIMYCRRDGVYHFDEVKIDEDGDWEDFIEIEPPDFITDKCFELLNLILGSGSLEEWLASERKSAKNAADAEMAAKFGM